MSTPTVTDPSFDIQAWIKAKRRSILDQDLVSETDRERCHARLVLLQELETDITHHGIVSRKRNQAQS